MQPAPSRDVRITYIGHATLLIEISGVRILTDPNFEGKLAGILRRVSPPGISLDQLPKLDALLLTHAHADHLSFKSLDQLPQNIPLFAPKTVARWLARKGYVHAIGIEPGERMELGEGRLRIHTQQAKHRGSRYVIDRWRNSANMYLVETNKESLFFAGDTALTDNTHKLVADTLWSANRQLDICLLPIGYAPAWKPGFRRGHLTGQDAMHLFERLAAREMIPYHWGTFQHVTATAYDSINRLRSQLQQHPKSDRVHILQPGESFCM